MASKKSSALADEDANVPLQAVVLADSFTQKFRPITMERPKVLLPLVNVPMIDYTLEWLATAGVKEVFVFCCAHSAQVTLHVDTFWKQQQGFTVTCIVALDCTSAGDALRVIDQKGVIRSDFVLVSGDTVSNMSLEVVLAEHRERRKKDKHAVLTMVLQRSQLHPISHQSRLGCEEQMYIIDPDSKQVVGMEMGAWAVSVDGAVLEGRESVCVRTDLQDCHVDICAPEVLYLFTDNFDFQHLRKDFVKNLLTDEILGNLVHCYEITSEYASRIHSLHAYHEVSRDVIQRWLYPLAPDSLFGSQRDRLQVSRGNLYRGERTEVERSVTVSGNSVLGEGTLVAAQAVVRESVIGRNCRIGQGAVIEGSYLWDGVVVGAGARVEAAVLCDRVEVKAGAQVGPGCVLSFGVGVGEGVELAPYSRLSLKAQPQEEDSSDEECEYNQGGAEEEEEEARGLGGGEEGVIGYRWEAQEEEWRYSVAPIPADRWQQMAEAAERAEREAGREEEVSGEGAAKEVVVEEESSECSSVDDDAVFRSEVEESFEGMVREGASTANTYLEIMGSRAAWDKSIDECASVVLRCLLSLLLKEGQEVGASARRVVKARGGLLRRFCERQQDVQVEVLLTLEECCSEEFVALAPFFAQLLEVLYEEDVVEEGAILAWASEKEFAEEADIVFVDQAAVFLKWLSEAEEESEEEGISGATFGEASLTNTGMGGEEGKGGEGAEVEKEREVE